MAPYSFLLLVLASCAHSWPQLSASNGYHPPAVPRGNVSPRQLPVVEEDTPLMTLPALHRAPAQRRPSPRQLPVGEDLDMSAMTLPVLQRTKSDRSRGKPRQAPVERSDDLPGVLTLPVVHSTKPGVFKRAVEVELANRSDVAYYAQLNFGTPPQPVFVQLDTGSFELWVNPDCTVLPERDVPFCEAVGSYDVSLSNTVMELDGTQSLLYGIGAANISYVRDVIGLPESTATLRDVQFGVATSTEDQFAGILGLGHGQGVTTTYRTFLDELMAQGVTSTKAFSLGLGAKDDQEGVVVFGGVDTAKFAGGLAPLPLIPPEDSPDGVPRYWVQLKSIALSPPGAGPAGVGRIGAKIGGGRAYDGSSIAVFLDSGATLTLLPPELARAIAADFGAEGEDDDGFYAVDCAHAASEGTLDFSFEGVTIRVPYREMIRELRNPPRCYLGIIPSEDFVLLGDSFLRSAYVVFDPDDAMAYIAQYKNCGSTVRSLNSTDVIPTLYGICGLTENSVLPSEVGEVTGGGEEEEEVPGQTAAAGPRTGRAGWAGVSLASACWAVMWGVGLVVW